MKRFWAFTLAMALLLTLLSAGAMRITANAASGEVEGFTYEIYDGKATITGYTDTYNYYVEVPQTLDGYPVVSIGAHAFEDYATLIEITIPEGVETIEPFAFYQCANLVRVYMPDSLVSIGEKAFCNCQRLVTLEFGDGLEYIGYGAFSFCSKLDYYLDLPNSLEVIDSAAFYGCGTLETVMLPNSLQELGSKAFAMCSRLDYIAIPDGIPKVGSQLIYGSLCYSYSTNWYNNVLYMGSYLLEAQKSISGSCQIPEGIVNIADGAFENCDDLTEVLFPEDLEIIGANTFNDCSSLQRAVFSSGVTTIGDEAFYNCKALTDIQLPDSVTHIGQDAFTKTGYYNDVDNWDNGALYVGSHLVCSNSSAAGVLQVRAGTKTIVAAAMKGRKQITELIVPNTVISIGDEAFSECTALAKVTLSDSVTDIGEKAFYGCSALNNVHFGKGVARIGNSAFGHCSGLESISVDSANTNYYSVNNCLIRTTDKCLALGCKTSQIPSDGTVTAIGPYAFEGCDGLTELTFPNAILTIGEGAFKECDKLLSVKLGNGVQVVGKSAFEHCDMLAQIDFGTSVHTIEYRGFGYSQQFTTLEFPASLRHLGEEAFSNCTGLVSVTFREGLVSIGKNCFYFCENLTSLIFPNSLQTIEAGAFYACEKVAVLSLGENLTSIGDAAFLGCESIETLAIPGNVKTIGSSAFSECTKLQQLDLGNVEKIGYAAFESCKSLTQVHIPASVKEMGNMVFSYCPAIEEMTVSPQNQHYYSQDNCIICMDGYYLAFGCKNSIIPADGIVDAIDGYAFAGCTGLKSIAVPDSVTLICAYAFLDCSGLEEMYLPFIGGDEGIGTHYLGYIFGAVTPSQNDGFVPSSLERVVISRGTDVSTGAFMNCCYLEEIILPETVTSIGYDAFQNCTRLEKVVLPGDLQEVKDDNIFATAPSAMLYISAGQDDTKSYAQDNGIPHRVGGLVTFVDNRGVCVNKEWYSYGAQITEPDLPVTPEHTALYDPALGSCTGNQTIKRFEVSIHADYVITFKNWDGSVLSQKNYYWGEEVIAPPDPTRPENSMGTYTFAGWNKPIVNCAGNATYTATYTLTSRPYKVIFEDWDGTVLSTQTYKDGERVVAPADPIRAADDNYTYTFSGWERTNVTVDGDVIYTATYTKTPKETPTPNTANVTRVFGADRYSTAFKAADTLKAQLGVTKFSTIVVACGTDFADALAGSYLANQKNAPILLVRNRAQEMNQVKAYIKQNLAAGGTVYLLGGVNAVPKAMETGLEGFQVKRLGGATRYDTNLLILKEAGVAGKDMIVCTGKNFADSLSASATGLPILLVKDGLTAAQKEFLTANAGKKIIVGGNNAVNTTIEKQLKTYGEVKRLAGSTRYDTSILVAEEFFQNPTTAVLAYAQNFPDGLSGGTLAYALHAPLILTDSNKSAAAVKYGTQLGIKSGYVLGGTGLISDKVVRNTFSMAATDTITVK